MPPYFIETEATYPAMMHGRLTTVSRNFPILLLLLDGVLVASMIMLAYVLRVGWPVVTPSLVLNAMVPGLVIFLVLYTINGYARDRSFDGGGYAIEHLAAIAVAYLLSLAINGFFNIEALGAVESRAAGILGFVMAGGATLFARRSLGRIVRDQLRSKTLCVLGDAQQVRQLLESLRDAGETRKVVALVLNQSDGVFPDGFDVRFMSDPTEAIAELPASCDEIVVAEDYRRFDQAFVGLLVSRYLRGMTVFAIDRFYEHRFNRVWLPSVTHSWLLDGELVLRRGIAWARIKRLFDLIVALTMLVVLGPAMIVVGLLIALEARGPIIFRQRRMGMDGIPFIIFKFLTMETGSENGRPYTGENDARVTRFGAFIRRRRIDELPQLWNVIRGNMSLVGPRAESVDLVEAYQAEIPFYHFRHVLRPGVTGLAQIRQGYAASPADAMRKLEYDLYYVRHYNILWDIRIMLRTLHVIIRGDGR